MGKDRFAEILNLAFFQRKMDAQKSDYGRLLLLGGSAIYPNALLLAGKGAQAAGPGYLSFHADPEVRLITKRRAPLTAIYLDELREDSIKPYDAFVFGNGLKESPENEAKLHMLLSHLEEHQILLVDATGIKMFLKARELCHPNGKILLTPHLGEAASLFGKKSISKQAEDYLDSAAAFSKKNGVYLLLKGYHSLLIGPLGEVFPSDYPPTPSLAKAGSGDVLAGFLGGLLSYLPRFGVSFMETIRFGDRLFHLCFQEAERKESQALLSPSDFLKTLKSFLKRHRP